MFSVKQNKYWGTFGLSVLILRAPSGSGHSHTNVSQDSCSDAKVHWLCLSPAPK